MLGFVLYLPMATVAEAPPPQPVPPAFCDDYRTPRCCTPTYGPDGLPLDRYRIDVKAEWLGEALGVVAGFELRGEGRSEYDRYRKAAVRSGLPIVVVLSDAFHQRPVTQATKVRSPVRWTLERNLRDAKKHWRPGRDVTILTVTIQGDVYQTAAGRGPSVSVTVWWAKARKRSDSNSPAGLEYSSREYYCVNQGPGGWVVDFRGSSRCTEAVGCTRE